MSYQGGGDFWRFRTGSSEAQCVLALHPPDPVWHKRFDVKALVVLLQVGQRVFEPEGPKDSDTPSTHAHATRTRTRTRTRTTSTLACISVQHTQMCVSLYMSVFMSLWRILVIRTRSGTSSWRPTAKQAHIDISKTHLGNSSLPSGPTTGATKRKSSVSTSGSSVPNMERITCFAFPTSASGLIGKLDRASVLRRSPCPRAHEFARVVRGVYFFWTTGHSS
jgi:hypothetical protein